MIGLVGVIVTICSSVVAAQDVDEIFLVRTQLYDQYSPLIASLSEERDFEFANGPHSFGVFVAMAEEGAVTGGTFTAPGSLAIPLVEDDDEWIYEESFEFLAEMDDRYGTGTYEVAIATTNDGLKQVSIDLPVGDYPALTTFSNFLAAQAVDPTQDFVLTWNAIANGSATDFVVVEIEEENGPSVFFSEDFVELNGLSTQVTIPRNTLEPGKRYLVNLEAYTVRISPSDADYPGVTYGSGDGKVLRMPMQTTGTMSDADDPSLQYTTPFDGAEGYQRDGAVVFQFSEPMDTGIAEADAIAWTGINPGLVTYTWNPTGIILFCYYQGGLPASTEVNWELNAAGSGAKLRDEAGNELAPQQGMFLTSGEAPAGGSGIAELLIGKVRVSFQDGPVPVELGYSAELYVDLNRPGAVVSADLQIPGRGTVIDLGQFEEFSDFQELDAEAGFSESSDVARIFPSGEYTAVLKDGSGGTTEVALTFGADQYPSTPTLMGLAALQDADPTQDITLTWNPMLGGTVDDFIVVSIESDGGRCFFESPDLGEAGSLNGTDTSITIPAGTLPPGQSMELELAFVRLVDDDPMVSFNTFGAFASFTIAEISTSGDPTIPIRVVAGRSGGKVSLTVEGEAGFGYELRASDSLDTDPSSWGPIYYGFIPDDCNGYLGTFQFVDDASDSLSKRFYQVRQLPNQ